MMRGDEEIREPADRLDALWEATRPIEPSAESWDQVWTSVAAGLDRRASDMITTRRDTFVHRSSPLVSRRPLAVAAAVAVVALAQAAAILLAVGLSWHGADSRQVATADVRIEEGQFVMIRSNADTVQAVDLSAQLGDDGVDAWYVMYNLLESTTNPVVVMSE